jgi:hypothetical protein
VASPSAKNIIFYSQDIEELESEGEIIDSSEEAKDPPNAKILHA